MRYSKSFTVLLISETIYAKNKYLSSQALAIKSPRNMVNTSLPKYKNIPTLLTISKDYK